MRRSSLIVTLPALASVVAALLFACTGDDQLLAPVVDPGAVDGQAAPLCGEATKRCGTACVSTSEPATGCAAESCAPCDLPHSEAACGGEGGGCSVAACEQGFGDCNAQGDDGCEANLRTSAAHCGACGRPCAEGLVCDEGACELAAVAASKAWLATKDSGFCAAAYNQLLNLCGDVEFCFDKRFMRDYPSGFAVDLGVYIGSDPVATLFGAGGDCDYEHMGVSVGDGKLWAIGFDSGVAQVSVTPGRHLVSAQWNAQGGGLFLDGRLVAQLGAPKSALRLRDSCGPGIVMGNRISYWWEKDKMPAHASAAYFFAHVRENVQDALSWDYATATKPGPSSVLYFDESGVQGSTWAAKVGGITAVGKNSKNDAQDPRIDGGADGPLPEWKKLADCPVQ